MSKMDVLLTGRAAWALRWEHGEQLILVPPEAVAEYGKQDAGGTPLLTAYETAKNGCHPLLQSPPPQKKMSASDKSVVRSCSTRSIDSSMATVAKATQEPHWP